MQSIDLFLMSKRKDRSVCEFGNQWFILALLRCTFTHSQLSPLSRWKVCCSDSFRPCLTSGTVLSDVTTIALTSRYAIFSRIVSRIWKIYERRTYDFPLINPNFCQNYLKFYQKQRGFPETSHFSFTLFHNV